VTQTAWLVAARCAGLVSRAPGLAHPAVPAPVRLGCAAALALAVAPQVRAAAPLAPTAFVLALAGELALGALLGLGAAVLYDGAYAGGRAVDDYVGIRGSVPLANVTSTQAFGRLWSATFLAGLFVLDGYMPLVHGVARSFDRLAPGALVAPGTALAFAAALPRALLDAALLVAAPALAAAAVVQIALAAVARVVPRFASFTLAFPATLAVALLATLLALPVLAPLSAHPR
jgi:flagellar biosynthesis protein FliR